MLYYSYIIYNIQYIINIDRPILSCHVPISSVQKWNLELGMCLLLCTNYSSYCSLIYTAYINEYNLTHFDATKSVP